jgi:protein TonB
MQSFHHRRALLGLLQALLAISVVGQISYDEAAPFFDAFEPTVVGYAEALPVEKDAPPPIATVVNAKGKPQGPRMSAKGDPLPPISKDAQLWATARNYGKPTYGAFWAASPASFHFVVDQTEASLPKPRFIIPRVQAEKYLLIARALEKGFLRIQIEVNASGKITHVETGNKTLTKITNELLDDVAPEDGHPFEPARRHSDGKGIRIAGEMRWDLAPRPQGGVTWDTDTLAWENLKGPKEEISVYVSADGHGGVKGAWLADQTYKNHRALNEVLLTALALPFPDSVPDQVERWTMRVSPILNTVRRFRRQPIDLRQPIMLIAPRPEYPKKLWRRGSEGYVYVRFLINTEGTLSEIEVIESSKDAFDQAAIDALSLWEFEPMVFDGRNITSEVIMTLPFRVPARQ